MQDLTCNNSWPQALPSWSEWAQVGDSSVLSLFCSPVWLSLGPLKGESRCLYTLDKLIKSTAVISRVNLPHSGKYLGLPRWLSGKKFACNAGDIMRYGFDPCVGKVPWRRAWKPTPVFLPGESYGQRNPVGCNSWGHKEPDKTEHTHREYLLEVPHLAILG